ncbi:MAG: hypothetical protein MI975_27240 [Cytophagales bacterium]|nr:hypothetical protein [Cytophagales bacterium]
MDEYRDYWSNSFYVFTRTMKFRYFRFAVVSSLPRWISPGQNLIGSNPLFRNLKPTTGKTDIDRSPYGSEAL